MLKIYPKQGQILICDFKGMIYPEMCKVRPVVVISPNGIHGGKVNLCTIVPLSSTQPRVIKDYHVKLTSYILPKPYTNPVMWAKCNMIYTVSFDRLFPFKVSKNTEGKRLYVNYYVEQWDLENIKRAVVCGLGLQYFVK